MNPKDPRKDPTQWLQQVLIDLLEQNTVESKATLREALIILPQWLEPGLIDQVFHSWIEQYLSLLHECENNQNNDQQAYPLEDLWE